MTTLAPPGPRRDSRGPRADTTAAPSPPGPVWRGRPGIAYYLALLAVAANIVDAWLFPQASNDSGGLKFYGVRLTDELCVLSIVASIAALASGRLRLPRMVAAPLALVSWVWLEGVLVGLQAHNNHRVLFAELHVVLYFTAVLVAWLQVPTETVRRHEMLLVPLALVAALALLPSHAAEKGGDLSTIAAGIAAIAVVRYRGWLAAPLVVVSAALVITGGQRAALLFSLPPLVVGVAVALRRVRWTAAKVAVLSALVVAGSALLALYSAALIRAIESFRLNTFDRVGKVQASDSRKDQLSLAIPQIHQAPLIGHGLGHQYQLYNAASRQTVLTDITHDIYLDALLRFGLLGSAVLLAVLIWAVARAWRLRHRMQPVHRVAVVFLFFLLIHGAVESVVDKPRLMLFAAWMTASLLQVARTRPPAAVPAVLADAPARAG